MTLDSDPPIPLIRELFLEYAESLGLDLCFQNFEEELRTLPGRYQVLLVAMDGDTAAGCIALRPLAADSTGEKAEMKRLYVRAQYRKRGVGRLLVEALIAHARELRYRFLVLDSMPSMVSAIALYRSLGFRQTLAFRKMNDPDLVFFELDLHPPSTR